MKALSIPEPKRVEVIDAPVPKCAPGEVLLRVDRVGFCGTDLNAYRGLNPLVSYPRIPGHEIAATVIESEKSREGEAVLVFPYTNCGACHPCRTGRPNCCRANQTLGVQRDGGFCEYLAIPAEKAIAAPGLSEAELALVEPLSIGFHAVARGNFSGVDTVAVLGCGMIGLGAIAGAARKGARVVAVDIDDEKLAIAKKTGAWQTIHSAHENLHDVLQEMTGGEGPSGIIEAIGLPQTFRAAVEEVSFAGKVVYIGYAREAVSYETKLFVQKELNIYGSRNATLAEFSDVVALLRDGHFPVKETITRTVPLADAPRALEEWSANPQCTTKIHVLLHEK